MLNEEWCRGVIKSSKFESFECLGSQGNSNAKTSRSKAGEDFQSFFQKFQECLPATNDNDKEKIASETGCRPQVSHGKHMHHSWDWASHCQNVDQSNDLTENEETAEAGTESTSDSSQGDTETSAANEGDTSNNVEEVDQADSGSDTNKALETETTDNTSNSSSAANTVLEELSKRFPELEPYLKTISGSKELSEKFNSAINESFGDLDLSNSTTYDLGALSQQLIDALKALYFNYKKETNTTDESTSENTDTTTDTTPVNSSELAESSKPGTLSFSEKLSNGLEASADSRISETDLQHSVISYQLYQKDAQLADSFKSAYQTASADLGDPRAAMKSALSKLVDTSKLTSSEASWVYSLSAKAANFETGQSDLSSLVSGNHGMEKKAALKFAEATLAGIQSGAVKVNALEI